MSLRYKGAVISATPPTVNSSQARGIWTMQQQFQNAGVWPQQPPTPDEFFEYVSMLLPGNGTNGAQNNTFLDSSTNAFSITRNGNTTQGTFSPYGTLWSNYFDGTDDYLSLTDNGAFDFGTGDFTIECWIYKTKNASEGDSIVAGIGPTNGSWMFAASNGDIRFGKNYVSWDATTASNLVPLNTWHHVVVCRASGTLRLFVNGVQGFSGANSENYNINDSTLAVGARQRFGGQATPGEFFNGYISNLRILKGTALYTSAFTPPTAPLTAITNTSLLTCQSNRFRDASTNNFAITSNGNTSVQRFSPFNPTASYSAATIGGSGYFDGAGDYLSSPDNTAVEFGSGNFTIEAWAYPLDGGWQLLIAKSPDNQATGWQLFASGDEVNFYASNGSGSWNVGFFTSGAAVQRNAWNHIAVTRSGSTWTIWVNGVSKATATSSITINNNTTPVFVGTFSNASYYSYGYVADVRIVKGTAVYTSAFTPPTAPLTAITNTSLLLNFANAGITDAAMMNDLETVGNAQISTAQSKFGGGSMYFDGNGDFLQGSTNPQLDFDTGDFTIECWFYLAGNSPANSSNGIRGATLYAVTNDNSSGTAYGYGLGIDGNTTTTGTGITFVSNINNNELVASYVGTISQQTWHHVAVTRQSGTVRIFFNGAVVNTTSFAGRNIIANGNPVYVGRTGFIGYLSQLNGYIDDLRITKGFARYTANFTPPTAPFPTL